MATKYYTVIKNFLTEEECDRIYDKMNILRKAGQGGHDDFCDKSWSFYSFASPQFIEKIKHGMEETFDLELMYTFDYSRIYMEGETLRPHTDRAMCEYSATINIRNMDQPWTFYYRDPITEKENSINMMKGDAVLYRGSEVEHWRNELVGPDVYQTMIFYCTKELFEAQDPNKRPGEQGYSKEAGLFREKQELKGLFKSKG